MHCMYVCTVLDFDSEGLSPGLGMSLPESGDVYPNLLSTAESLA
jgi:hypothetical protein